MTKSFSPVENVESGKSGTGRQIIAFVLPTYSLPTPRFSLLSEREIWNSRNQETDAFPGGHGSFPEIPQSSCLCPPVVLTISQYRRLPHPVTPQTRSHEGQPHPGGFRERAAPAARPDRARTEIFSSIRPLRRKWSPSPPTFRRSAITPLLRLAKSPAPKGMNRSGNNYRNAPSAAFIPNR